jgi:membrane protein implicated in regulation of membrane protease activity
MGVININWTLFWQIAGPIIALLGIIIMVVLFLWPRREKVKIKTGGLNHRVGERAQNKVAIFKLYTTELQRTGGKDIRYLTQILLKLDEHL